MPNNSVNRKSNDSNVKSSPTFGPTPPAEALDNATAGLLIRLAFLVPKGTPMGPDSELGGSLARFAEAVKLVGRQKATQLVDAERRRWYAALEGTDLTNLEGLAPEVVAERVMAREQEIDRLTAALEAAESQLEITRLKGERA